jgi:hypothetical protein
LRITSRQNSTSPVLANPGRPSFPAGSGPEGASARQAAGGGSGEDTLASDKPKIYVAFHWHMHQPIYWPGQDIVETSRNPECTDNPIPHVTWPDRVHGYTHYMADAVEQNSNLPHMGAQVSWTGSLTENRVEGQRDCLIQYYVEAEDGAGNITRSPIQHVRVA